MSSFFTSIADHYIVSSTTKAEKHSTALSVILTDVIYETFISKHVLGSAYLSVVYSIANK